MVRACVCVLVCTCAPRRYPEWGEAVMAALPLTGGTEKIGRGEKLGKGKQVCVREI